MIQSFLINFMIGFWLKLQKFLVNLQSILKIKNSVIVIDQTLTIKYVKDTIISIPLLSTLFIITKFQKEIVFLFFLGIMNTNIILKMEN